MSDDPIAVHVEIPIRTVSESNVRGHWSRHHKRHQNQHGSAMLLTRLVCINCRSYGPPASVTMRRVAPRLLDEGNVAASMKYVQDGVAEGLQINDGDRSISWAYEQRIGPYAVEVDIMWAAGLDSAQADGG